MIEKKRNAQTYTREQVYEQTLKYFNGDDLAANVWIDKYCLKDNINNYYELTPTDMHHRIASELARIEQKYPNSMSENEIFNLLDKFRYVVPQGRPMAGIGNDGQVQSISNCFVIGYDDDIASDSYGAILQLDQQLVQIAKRSGGIGLDISFIRPNGSPVNNAAMTSTGIVPFMERFSNSTREVGQNNRRGANIQTIDVSHYQLEDFISAKDDKTKITGSNLSIKITDEFMNAVENDLEFELKYPVNSDNPSFKKIVNAKKLWDKIIAHNISGSEPGVLNWSTIERESIPDCYADEGFKSLSVNPCGEIVLSKYDSCRLMVLNATSYVENPFSDNASFNFKLFEEHSAKAQRLMDDLVDLEIEKVDKIIQKIESDPEPPEIKAIELDLWKRIKEVGKKGRRTGLGHTGLGDTIAMLNMNYGQLDSLEFADKFQRTLNKGAYKSTINMAKERGTFPVYDYDKEKDNIYLKRVLENAPELVEDLKKYGRRNIALLTNSPTGSTSTLTQTSSGVEPIFMTHYKRRTKNMSGQTKVDFVDATGDEWQEYTVYHHMFQKYLTHIGINKNKLSEDELKNIIDKSPFKYTAHNINYLNKVDMIATLQKFNCHAISNTTNLPRNVTFDEVDKLYRYAWKQGCKGLTIYVDGSRDGVLISDNNSKTTSSELDSFFPQDAPKRPIELHAVVQHFQNNKEKWVGIIGLFDGHPYEMFTGALESFPIPKYIKDGKIIKIHDNGNGSRYDFVYTDKDGFEVIMQGLNREFNREYWNYGKLVSMILRHRAPLKYVIKIIDDLKFDNIEYSILSSWKKGVIRIIKRFIKDGEKAIGGETCQNCGSTDLAYQEGCLVCLSCGSSKCG